MTPHPSPHHPPAPQNKQQALRLKLRALEPPADMPEPDRSRVRALTIVHYDGLEAPTTIGVKGGASHRVTGATGDGPGRGVMREQVLCMLAHTALPRPALRPQRLPANERAPLPHHMLLPVNAIVPVRSSRRLP